MSYWFSDKAATSDYRYSPQSSFPTAPLPTGQLNATKTLQKTYRPAQGSKFGDPATLSARERMRREDLISVIQKSHQTQQISQWYARQNSGRRAAERQRNQTSLVAELSMANEELKNVRREKLKARLLADERIWSSELSSQGLAVFRQQE